MVQGKRVAVVVPCFNEAQQIGRVLETIPDFVDCVVVVDDTSVDGTAETVQRIVTQEGSDSRVVLIRHPLNQGVGRAIVTGYREALARGADVIAVMAGDGQMNPAELRLLVDPVAAGLADYAKGNRFFYQNAWSSIPKVRYLGNAFLSMLTKIASGYWHSADSQTGYTAISSDVLRLLDLDQLYPRYGYPNDLLIQLNLYDSRVVDVPIQPLYGVGERSKMRLWKVVPTVSWLIFRRFVWRLFAKYVVRDFHPLVFFYGFGALTFSLGAFFGLYLLFHRFTSGPVVATSALLAALLVISGLQLLLFAMWFDMEHNRHLAVRRPPTRPSSER